MFSAAGASAFLPFLPMLPSQILLNNLIYDATQIAIPSDRVDPRSTRTNWPAPRTGTCARSASSCSRSDH
jgi:hypothetical protein